MFYYMLGNIRPNKRSKLKGIQLLAVCKHVLIKKYGMNRILKPIVDDIKTLVRLYYKVPSEISNLHICI